MDESRPGCHLGYMESPRSALPDEVHGARAAGALLVGDLASAEADLACARTRYLAGFLCRLAVIAPSVSLRLAWRVGARRWMGARATRGSR